MLENEIKELLNQRFVSYVDILEEPIKNGDEIRFRVKECYKSYSIYYNETTIGHGIYYIIIKGRKIQFISDEDGYEFILFEKDLTNGYISIDELTINTYCEDVIKITYHEFSKEQKEYNEIHDYLYPRYDIGLESFIMNNMLGYKIFVKILLNPLDETPYVIDTYVPVTIDKGMDLVIDTMIELYNIILSKDFRSFFELDTINIIGCNIPGRENVKGEYKIIDHHYTDHTFLCENIDSGLELQIEYLEYFINKQYILDINNSEPLFDDEIEN